MYSRRRLFAKAMAPMVALALSIMGLSAPARAQVKPGDFITPENAAKVNFHYAVKRLRQILGEREREREATP